MSEQRQLTQEELSEVGIIKKGRIAQYFCKHKNKQEFVARGLLVNIQGDRIMEVCKDCGKTTGERFQYHY